MKGYVDGFDGQKKQPKTETIAELIKVRFNMSVNVVTTREIQDNIASAEMAHKSRSSEETGPTM